MDDQSPIYVVDDDDAIRKSLGKLLESAGWPVETFDSAEGLLARIDSARTSTGCVLADIRMPGLSGLELLQEMSARSSTLPVILITGHADVPMAVRAMKLGAFDLLQKPFDDQVLLDRVRAAVERGDQLQRQQSTREAFGRRFESLTPREQEVFAFVVKGLTSSQIARRLHRSEKTIKLHRAHIMRKFGTDSAAELVRLAMSAEYDGGAAGTSR